MRQAIELTGPGASLDEVAAALGITPERQAALRDILGLRYQEKTPQNGLKHKVAATKATNKKSASRK